MQNKDIFDFRDYKTYLKYVADGKPRGGRGFRAEIARAARCQTAYVSQVLNSGAHFGLEQAYALNHLLLHGHEEAHYFILLVQYARAGTQELKDYFLELMGDALQRKLNLKERFKIKETLSFEDRAHYYSEWYFAAIHILLTIPRCRNPIEISKYLNFPLLKVERILKFLVKAGLAIEEKSGYNIGTTRIHLGKDSPLISKHHINWRHKSIQSLEKEIENNLHYTSIVSVSRQDALLIKSRVIKEIDAFNSIVKDSKEEELFCFALDFFSMASE